jgi:hypothetical protein
MSNYTINPKKAQEVFGKFSGKVMPGDAIIRRGHKKREKTIPKGGQGYNNLYWVGMISGDEYSQKIVTL